MIVGSVLKNTILKYLYIVYQYLIALPIMVIETILAAIITLVCVRFKYSVWLHRIQALWARIFCYVLFIPVTIEGGGKLKEGKSYVFVSNHQSMVDIFLIYGWLPVVFKWLIKKELHRIPLVGIACDAAGHIFVDRASRGSTVVSVRRLEHILQDGCSTVIFPEGHRSQDGRLQPFRRGAFQMAIDMNVPIVPIALSGCFEVINPSRKYLIRHPLKMHIGDPIELTDEIRSRPDIFMESIHQYIAKHIEN